MCPYASSGGPARTIDDQLYSRILGELAATGTLKLFSPMLQNEPLLDRHLPERIGLARRILGPKVKIGTVTNGSLLTEERIRALVNAGPNWIAVSLDAYRRETYETIRPGLDFDRVRRNVLALLRYHGRVSVQIRFLIQQQNRTEEAAFRRYWLARGAHVAVMEATNRASTLDSYEEVYARRPQRSVDLVREPLKWLAGRLYPACTLPFTALSVLVDGRVIACCHDWGPAEVVGDLSRQSLEDVWNGPEMNRVRQLLVERRFEQSDACVGCSLVRAGGTCHW
jgi:radical SAM protein with 4Fe4S-binding SPASM domain